MEYNFRFKIDEYSAALKISYKFDKKLIYIRKLLNKVIIGIYILSCLAALLNGGVMLFFNYIIIEGLMVIVFFILSSDKVIDKYRLIRVKKHVSKNPPVLEYCIKIDDENISYSHDKSTLTTKISDVVEVIEIDNIIVMLNSENNIIAFIPSSYFSKPSDKQYFINQFYDK